VPAPAAFVAVTATAIVAPTSPGWTAYAELVAPVMFAQFAPVGSQLSHW
jgi:hypothetical protein